MSPIINGDGTQRRDLPHDLDVKSVKLKKHLSHDLDGGGETRGLCRPDYFYTVKLILVVFVLFLRR
ncbi:MAG: hypothetical protein WCO57_01150, partial [Verrucomicrobiota bacterium]